MVSVVDLDTKMAAKQQRQGDRSTSCNDLSTSCNDHTHLLDVTTDSFLERGWV